MLKVVLKVSLLVGCLSFLWEAANKELNCGFLEMYRMEVFRKAAEDLRICIREFRLQSVEVWLELRWLVEPHGFGEEHQSRTTGPAGSPQNYFSSKQNYLDVLA